MQADSSLKSKTVNGLGWSFLDNFSRLGISFVVGVILARLLSPDEYGLISILTIFVTVIGALVDSGFYNALIRKKEATDLDYSTVFITNFVISIVLSIVLFFSAPLVASFFERPELVPLTRVMSCIVIINALCLVQRARMTKNINFKIQTKVTLIATVGSGVVGIGLAYAGFGVWALAWHHIALQMLTTVSFWFFNRWIPSLQFSWKSFSEMWSFGWKILVSNLIDTTWKQMYQIIVAKFYSPETLGYYTRSAHFSQLFSNNLTSIIQRVSFPVLSSIQDDKVRLRAAYKKLIKTTMLPTFVLMMGMSACSKALILSLIGEKWTMSIPFLQLICFVGMFYPLHAINLNMLQVQGRSDLYLKLEIIKKIIALIPLVIGAFVGIFPMLFSSIVINVISYYLNAFYSGKFLNYGIVEQVKDIFPSFSIALVMAIAVSLIGLLEINCYVLLLLQIAIGASFVILVCEKSGNAEYQQIKDIIRKRL